jgi:hypothetical protein
MQHRQVNAPVIWIHEAPSLTGETGAGICIFKKILTEFFKPVSLAQNWIKEMKPKSLQTHLKRCSWWWRANPTG